MNKPVALSLTPLPLQADSRTLRIAASLARFGFESRVIEGQESSEDPAKGLSIYLEALHRRSPPKTKSSPTSSIRSGLLSSTIATVRKGRFGAPGNWALYAAFRHHYARLFNSIRLKGSERLIYLHSYEYYECIADQARLAGVPIVYDAHDYYQGILPPGERSTFDKRYMLPFLRKREEACVKGAHTVVTVSEGAAALIEREYGRRPIVLRNGHDARLDTPPGPTLRARLGLAPTDFLVVVVGNFKPGMAIDSVVDAVEFLPANVHVAFVGRGYAASLIPTALRNRLHLGIAVQPRQVVPLIQTADVGLVAYRPISENYRHALPNGFFQVVAAGLPLVYSALPEIDATVGGLDVGWRMAEITGASIADGIAQVLANHAKCRETVVRLATEIAWERDEHVLARLIQEVASASDV